MQVEEQVVQEFPRRCPYCDQIVSYDDLHLKPGENEIKCLSCKKKYIKVVPDNSPPPLPAPKRLPSARLPALRDHVQGLEAGLRAGRHRGGGEKIKENKK